MDVLEFGGMPDGAAVVQHHEMLHGVVEVAVFVVDADQRQLLLVQADDRRTQHGRKRDVLPRVIDHLQERQDDRHFGPLEIAFRVVQDDRYLEVLEDLQDDQVVLLRRRQQHDVAVRQRPLRLRFFVVDGEMLVDQSLDLLRHHRDFSGGLVVDRHVRFQVVLFGEHFLIAVRILRQVDQQLRLVAFAYRKGLVAGLQLRGFVIGHLPHLLIHQLFEDEIREVDDLRARTEVFRQDDPFPAVLVGEGRVFAQEQARVRQAERIDGLLDVAHHEQVLGFGLVPRDPMEDAFLQLVHVLVFVDQHFLEFVAVIGAGIAHPAFAVGGKGRQNLQRQMLQVVEVQHIVRQFAFPIGFGEAFRDARHLFGVREDALQHLLLFRQRTVEVLLRQGAEIFLVLVAQVLQLAFALLQFIVVGFLAAGPAREVQLLRHDAVAHFIVVLLDRFQQLDGIAALRFQDFPLRRRFDILTGQVQGLFGIVADAFDQAQHLRLQQFPVEQAVHQSVVGAVQAGQGIQPTVRVRVRPGELVEREDQLHQVFVAAVLRIGLRQFLEEGVRFPVKLFLHLFPDVLLQQLHFDRVRQQAEDRIQIDQVEIALDDLQAEGVDRRDVRLRHQRQLLDQVQILLLRLRLVDGGLDGARHPFLHFLRGRFGEGHDQQLVDVRPALHFFDDPLYQHGRLA